MLGFWVYRRLVAGEPAHSDYKTVNGNNTGYRLMRSLRKLVAVLVSKTTYRTLFRRQ